MRGQRIVMVLAGAVALWCAAPLAVSAAPGGRAAAGTVAWRTAIEVPGLGSLNQGGSAAVFWVSCASTGNCAAGGIYTDGSAHNQAFVASEKNGTWGKAIEVPGTATVNSDGIARITSVSCASAGNCVAGGSYAPNAASFQPIVVSETAGTWGTATELHGVGEAGAVTSVFCASAGNCSAAGESNVQAFVASEKNGTWGTPIEVPGTARSVSCASAGNCSAGGSDAVSSGHSEAFVVNETNGTWGTAIEVPGMATLNGGTNASLNSVSCAKAGTCAGGGFYTDSHSKTQGFVVSQS
jgi:hypothetical protein